MNAGLAMTAAGAVLTGLAVATPADAEPPSYGSNGVFGVGAEPPDGWATASISRPAGIASTSRRACIRT